MVDCIIVQQIFTFPSPLHYGRNILPHCVDIGISHVTCIGQKNVCGSDARALGSGGEEVGLAFLHHRLWLSNKQLQERQSRQGRVG